MIAIEEAAQGFAAAGSEPRLAVLLALVRAGEGGLSVGEIQQRLDIPASTLAHHLKFLAAAGLVLQERQGRTIVNRAAYARLQALADFLLQACCSEPSDNGLLRALASGNQGAVR
jgi:ArsR family transcriptional regulator